MTSSALQPLFPRGKSFSRPMIRRLVWSPEAVWAFGIRGKSVAPTGLRTPDRPARSATAANLLWIRHKQMQNCEFLRLGRRCDGKQSYYEIYTCTVTYQSNITKLYELWIIYCIISARHVSGLYAHLQEQVDVIISLHIQHMVSLV